MLVAWGGHKSVVKEPVTLARDSGFDPNFLCFDSEGLVFQLTYLIFSLEGLFVLHVIKLSREGLDALNM